MRDPTNTSYWVVEIGAQGVNGSNVLRVPEEEATQIDRQVTDGLVEVLHFRDISGSLCVYPVRSFHGMYESTPEQREFGREHQRHVDAEVERIPGTD